MDNWNNLIIITYNRTICLLNGYKMVTDCNNSCGKILLYVKQAMKGMVYIIKFRKLLASVCSAVIVMSCAFFAPTEFYEKNTSGITASAAAEFSAPKLTVLHAYSNKIELKVDNLSSYPSSTSFKFIVDGNYVRSYSCKTLKSKNVVSLFDNGKCYFKGSTNYKIIAYAVNGSSCSPMQNMAVKTDGFTYYKMNSKAQLYKLSNGKITKSGTTLKLTYAKGVLSTSKGITIAGKSTSSCKGEYLKINEGTYKGQYVKTDSNIQRVSERTAKIQTVVQYAIGMNGGRYVWGGANYRACDCTGLTMLSYQQIGIDISHSTYVQAKKGKASSMKNIKTGDIIICNNYGHAALYIGDGKIIHAMNSYYGIRIQDISKLSYCGKVNCVRTII